MLLSLKWNNFVFGEQNPTRMNHLFVSQLIYSMRTNKQFFELEGVQRIIEYQFVETKKMMLINAAIFMAYFFPYLFVSLSNDKEMQTKFFGCSCIVHVYFLLIEYV